MFQARQNRQLRFLALFIATFFVSTLFSETAHYLLVQHTYCSEHMEMVHGGTHAHGQQGVANQDSGNQSDHDHCFVFHASLRAQKLTSRTALSPTYLPVTPVEVSSSSPTVARKTALYRLAPKNSPPA